MLTSYRITKYNPLNRDERWFYKDFEEWTSIHDFNDSNRQQYFLVEDRYIEAITWIMKIAGIQSLKIIRLELRNKYDELYFTSGIDREVYENIQEGGIIIESDIPTIIRLALREEGWFKLVWERNFFVHFWYDLYTFVGFKKKKSIEEKIQKLCIDGIFIERFRSPYLR